jgi:hypothetical protein
MTDIFRIEHDLETGEIKEVKLTAKEIAEAAKQDAEAIARSEAESTKAAEKAALLAKLGISSDEAKLLLS